MTALTVRLGAQDDRLHSNFQVARQPLRRAR